MNESSSNWVHYMGQTELELDFLGFLTRITKRQCHLMFSSYSMFCKIPQPAHKLLVDIPLKHSSFGFSTTTKW